MPKRKNPVNIPICCHTQKYSFCKRKKYLRLFKVAHKLPQRYFAAADQGQGFFIDRM